jgi:hypothetical protein
MNKSNSLIDFSYDRKIVHSSLSPVIKLAKRCMSRRIIFVLGCQRSGTTLLYMLLSSHPSIYGYNEDELVFSFPRLEIILRRALLRTIKSEYLCFKLPTKTPEIKYFQDEYSHSKILWIIRHPYSVVSSMRSLIVPRSGENWLKTYGRMELKRHSKIFPEINDIDFERIDQITLGAYIYYYKLMTLREYQAKKLNLYIIKFENLVKNTQKILKPILVQIGLGWSKSILFHYEQHRMKSYVGNNIGSRPIDKSRINPKLKLSLEEKEIIKSICNVHIKKYY